MAVYHMFGNQGVQEEVQDRVRIDQILKMVALLSWKHGVSTLTFTWIVSILPYFGHLKTLAVKT